ncbi:MAG: cell division protein FtsW [Clostridia bacterium]|nr:cell division protein FtsW [Clostridia bacterium]MBQ3077434.1 cell division protein FtsW [Clostridia bacterium]
MDLPFFVLVCLLVSMGLVMVFSASSASAYYRFGDSYYFIRSQLKWAVLGLVLMLATARLLNEKLLDLMVYPVVAVSLITLVLVLTPLGTELNGAQRWLFGFQPSEIAKLALILSMSKLICNNRKRIKTWEGGLLPCMLLLALFCGLVVLERHISATVLLLGIGVILMFIGGINVNWLCGLGAAGLGALGLVVLVSDYAKRRMYLWLNPEVEPLKGNFQITQSLLAIGSGGMFGLGIGKSRQKYMYIPEPQNDFIFAIICEELGFVGALIIILVFMLLIWRGFTIAYAAPDRFSSMVVVGIISQVALQTILNICVVTGLVPNTGIALPFFSAGGTSLVVLMFEMGIVLAISRRAKI